MIRAVTLACLALAVFVGGASAGSSQFATTTAKTTFRDRAGEDLAAPDVTTVTAATDGIQLALRVWIPSRTRLAEDMRLLVWLDADDNRATGLTVEGAERADHFLIVDPPRFGLAEAVLFRCSESACSPLSSRPPRFTYASGATFVLDAFMLGLRRIERFAFAVVATSGIGYDPATRRYDLANAHTDRAPDEGWWTYDASAVRYSRVRATPALPRAGKSFTLSMHANSAATSPPTRARLACALTIAPRRAVPARSARLTAEAALCAFDVPTGTRRRSFRATIRVTAGSSLAEGRVSGRIR